MKNKKYTLWEALRLHRRGIQLIHGLEPKLMPVLVLHCIVKAILPYLIIFLSSQILTELSGLRRPEELWKWVWITIASIAGGTLVSGILNHWQDAIFENYYVGKDRLFRDKFLTMDYADFDKTETHDLYAKIVQNENWSGWGFNILFFGVQNLLMSFIGMVSAVALTAGFFLQKTPAGPWEILNQPWLLLILFAGLLTIQAFSPLCENKAQTYWNIQDAECRLGNRIFSHFGFAYRDQNRAMDLRMYKQPELCIRYLQKNTAFTTKGPVAAYGRGRMGLLSGLGKALSVVTVAGFYVLVCLKAWAGAFGVGEVTRYIGAITAFSGNLAMFGQMLGSLKNNAPYMEDIYQFLDIPNAMYQGSLTTEKRSDRKYEVEFRDVSFRYPGSETWTLRHVSMKFKIGQRLAIVGENGSGKTTFIKLICRLYDPQEGEILLNGIDIRKYNYRDYMQIFSVVFQDFQLLSQPLGNNVSGSMDYDREKAEKALLDAGFGDRLRAMPLGLHTMLYKDLTQDGVEISGGEAQKIAIARALYKDAPFIILDEPTAALDPIAEAEIYAKFNAIAGDKTAIYISHRLSSCKFCDEIAVFKNGQVIQQGSHAQLLKDSKGEYFTLWNAQAQYYVEKASP